jgi:hypothetical protein
MTTKAKADLFAWLEQAAEHREKAHAEAGTTHASRKFSEHSEQIGMAGEYAFAHLTGLFPDVSLKLHGDGGADFTIALRHTVDIKTAVKPYYLIHEAGRVTASIYVLAEYTGEIMPAKFIGWEWGSVLKAAPVRDFGYGINNHHIRADKLRPMDLLVDRLVRFTH